MLSQELCSAARTSELETGSSSTVSGMLSSGSGCPPSEACNASVIWSDNWSSELIALVTALIELGD